MRKLSITHRGGFVHTFAQNFSKIVLRHAGDDARFCPSAAFQQNHHGRLAEKRGFEIAFAAAECFIGLDNAFEFHPVIAKRKPDAMAHNVGEKEAARRCAPILNPAKPGGIQSVQPPSAVGPVKDMVPRLGKKIGSGLLVEMCAPVAQMDQSGRFLNS